MVVRVAAPASASSIEELTLRPLKTVSDYNPHAMRFLVSWQSSSISDLPDRIALYHSGKGRFESLVHHEAGGRNAVEARLKAGKNSARRVYARPVVQMVVRSGLAARKEVVEAPARGTWGTHLLLTRLRTHLHSRFWRH